jgi:hypothetical protein
LGDPSLVLFWLAKHVIIFLLIPGDPSLALRRLGGMRDLLLTAGT